MIFKRKDFLSLKNVSADEIMYILNTSETMKYVLTQKNKKSPYLQGKSVISMFYEYSAKARLAYDLAANNMSANVVDLFVTREQLKAETLKDLGILLDQMGADFIVLRHPMAGASHFLAKNTKASVINAGDGYNENPGQALLDLLTIKEQKGDFENLTVALIGDIANSRAGKSIIWALIELGAKVRAGAPPNLIPANLADCGVKVYYDPAKAVEDADVIMCQRMTPHMQQKAIIPSLNEYRNLFKIDENLMRYAKKDAIVMHPGPINRETEIASDIVDSKHCIINDQIANSVAVRMAIYYLLSQMGGALSANIDQKL